MTHAPSASSLPPEDGHEMWLRYRPIPESDPRATAYRTHCGRMCVLGDSPLANAARSELRRGIEGMLGGVDEGNLGDFEGTVFAATMAACLQQEPPDAPHLRGMMALAPEAYRIRSARGGGVVIVGGGETGLIYGVFHFLRLLQTGADIDALDLEESPANPLRMANHWDNLDGSVERGYAGRSVFFWDELPVTRPHYRDYARFLASVGINACVVNNVNASKGGLEGWRLLTPEYLAKLLALGHIFRAYGIRLYVSAAFDSPMLIGGLDTADPLEPAVAQWWAQKANDLYTAIPDFGGFLVKADSEGQAGPYSYGRTHAEGANMLARALAPHGGTLLWRAFVYGHHGGDRATHAYRNFKPLDGRFDANVVVQIKHGPIDFQVREPVSPLFGALPATNTLIELQVTQEYTGHDTHLCCLAPYWQQDFNFDTHAEGAGSTVARIASGELFGRPVGGAAGVMNVGMDRNWTGHHLAQANTFAYGMLAWNPRRDLDAMTADWVRMTFGRDETVVRTLSAMLLRSWRIYEKYTAPLGITVLCEGGPHYDPQPEIRTRYHGGDEEGFGTDRTVATGSGFIGQYQPPVQAMYEPLKACPEVLLLFFHHVPYTHKMASGLTAIQTWYDLHYEGVDQAESLRRDWQSLEGKIDPQRYKEVLAKFDAQIAHARVWRDTVCEYFHRLSGISDEWGRF